MRVLALDLGSKCGWAKSDYEHGVWILGKQGEPTNVRYDRYREMLRAALTDDVDVVTAKIAVYEKVRSHGRAGSDAQHMYGVFEYITQEECKLAGIPLVAAEVTTIKKYATGNGRASKAEMVYAAQNKWGNAVKDDNEADALWMMDFVFSRGETPEEVMDGAVKGRGLSVCKA